MPAAADRGAADGAVPTESLRARLRVEPDERVRCAVLAAGDRGEDVVRTERRSTDGDADACQAAVTVTSGGERRREFVEGETNEYCVCHAFREVACAADIEGVRGTALVVSVTVPDRDALQNLVAALRAREATVHLEQVLPTAVGDANRELRIDARAVTPKQREAIAVAVDLGYYERPRGADLDDVADALGISRSAASQRLTAAERTLIDGFVAATNFERVEPAPGDDREDCDCVGDDHDRGCAGEQGDGTAVADERDVDDRDGGSDDADGAERATDRRPEAVAAD